MHIHVVANPASGLDEPVLAPLNRVARARGVTWTLDVTREEGDTERMADEGASAGADVVAVYGGDGTVAAAAHALAETDVPLAILPGGTGNTVAQELGVPLDLEAAFDLACAGDAPLTELDVMRVGGRTSLLRVGIGADARMIEEADREAKDRLGWLAYLLSAVGQLREGALAHLDITVDDERVATDALCCLTMNIGRIGRGGITFSSSVDPRDGLLDVLVVRDAAPTTLATMAGSVLGVVDTLASQEPDAAVRHLRGRRVRVTGTPPQPVHRDGDLLGTTPVEVQVVPAALRVLVPAP